MPCTTCWALHALHYMLCTTCLALHAEHFMLGTTLHGIAHEEHRVRRSHSLHGFTEGHEHCMWLRATGKTVVRALLDLMHLRLILDARSRVQSDTATTGEIASAFFLFLPRSHFLPAIWLPPPCLSDHRHSHHNEGAISAAL